MKVSTYCLSSRNATRLVMCKEAGMYGKLRKLGRQTATASNAKRGHRNLIPTSMVSPVGGSSRHGRLTKLTEMDYKPVRQKIYRQQERGGGM